MTVTSLLLIATAGANGLLAGASLDQSMKQLPARHRIGAIAFSGYSRAADLANGVAWYAALGIGTALLTVAAALVGLVGRPALPETVCLTVALAATLAHSFATSRAAPINFRQRTLGEDEKALAEVFDRFERWQTVRVVLQVLALGAVLASLALAYP